MIYLNQAGTSWPKPDVVRAAAADVLSSSVELWRERFHDAHARVASGLGVRDASRLLLTPGCTAALGVAISDHDWQPGDRIVVSGLEHHAVVRPATLLGHRGVELVVVPRGVDGPLDLDQLALELEAGGVRLVAMTAACNVTGEILPIREVIALAHDHGALCLIDGAQICGYLPVNVAKLGVDLFTFAGHKGLHAPWGIGGLYVAPGVTLSSPEASCEIGASGGGAACAPMPGYCDVGSVDLSALAGLAAGFDWLEQADLLGPARAHVDQITDALQQRPPTRIHGVREPEHRLPTIAFTVEGQGSADVAALFRRRGIQVAAGLQCAPLAHETLGTAPDGVVRISAGPYVTDDDVQAVLEAIASL